ncbi:MAG: hypothetical protein QOC92_100 [Acidimicrobiaceae bacterium]|jgi:hypothetical protein
MSRKLAEQFRESNGAPIDLGGTTVQMMYQPPPINTELDMLIRMRASADRAQGLRLKAKAGEIVINSAGLGGSAVVGHCPARGRRDSEAEVRSCRYDAPSMERVV